MADSLSPRGQVLPTEWMLISVVCQQLWRIWGQPMVDLFASRLTHRLPMYMSPHQDQAAFAVDAMLQPWSNMDVYAFPPFAMIRDVINKFRLSQNCRMILIAPWWPQREWFPDLVDLQVDVPKQLPLRRDLLLQPLGRQLHPNLLTLRLTGWRLSSVLEERNSFLEKCRLGLIRPDNNQPTTSTNTAGQFISSGAGLINIQPPGLL